MSRPYLHYAWQLSYFSGKTRCYLRYKNIPYVEKRLDFYTLTRRIKTKTGAAVMPVVVTPEGEWIQDTSEIIDRLEQRFPEPSVIPTTPVQKFASYLLELWSDEWWIPTAMHTRWSYPENYALFQRDAGDQLLPFFPRFLKNRAAAFTAKLLRGYLPSVGVVPEQFEVLNRWTEDMLDRLDGHFARHPYLLGDAPSLGDFGLVGPMYGHLGRDPWPKRELVAKRQHLRRWIDRMADPPGNYGALPPDDRLPDTLTPVFESIVREFLPMLAGILDETRHTLRKHADGKRLPRALGTIEFPMGPGRYRRAAMPYTLWMAQRMLDQFRVMNTADQGKVRNWLRALHGEDLLTMEIPRLNRVALRVAPALVPSPA